MKYQRIYCYGKEIGKQNDDDFVTRYIAENGEKIEVEYLIGNESWKQYRVHGKAFPTLKKAKMYLEMA